MLQTWRPYWRPTRCRGAGIEGRPRFHPRGDPASPHLARSVRNAVFTLVYPDFASGGRLQTVNVAPLAEGVHAVPGDSGRGTGAAVVVLGFQLLRIGELPVLSPVAASKQYSVSVLEAFPSVDTRPPQHSSRNSRSPPSSSKGLHWPPRPRSNQFFSESPFMGGPRNIGQSSPCNPARQTESHHARINLHCRTLPINPAASIGRIRTNPPGSISTPRATSSGNASPAEPPPVPNSSRAIARVRIRIWCRQLGFPPTSAEPEPAPAKSSQASRQDVP